MRNYLLPYRFIWSLTVFGESIQPANLWIKAIDKYINTVRIKVKLSLLTCSGNAICHWHWPRDELSKRGHQFSGICVPGYSMTN